MEKGQDFLLQMLSLLFLDSKRRSKLVVVRGCDSITEYQASQFDGKKPGLQAPSYMLHSRLRQRGSHCRSHINKKAKLEGILWSYVYQARINTIKSSNKRTRNIVKRGGRNFIEEYVPLTVPCQ